MHKASSIALISALLWLLSMPASAADSNDAATLRRMSQELLDAIAPGQVDVWERYLDRRFVHMDENGTVRDKTQLLQELKPLPSGLVGRIAIDRFRSEFHDGTAVTAYEIQEYLDYHGQPLRTRFRIMDTWVKSGDGWRLVAQHTAAVLKDPPAVALRLPPDCEYAGVYALTGTIETTIACDGDELVASRKDRPVARYKAELRDLFFMPAQPRTRRIFQRNRAGMITGFADRREGEDVSWTMRSAPGD